MYSRGSGFGASQSNSLSMVAGEQDPGLITARSGVRGIPSTSRQTRWVSAPGSGAGVLRGPRCCETERGRSRRAAAPEQRMHHIGPRGSASATADAHRLHRAGSSALLTPAACSRSATSCGCARRPNRQSGTSPVDACHRSGGRRRRRSTRRTTRRRRHRQHQMFDVGWHLGCIAG